MIVRLKLIILILSSQFSFLYTSTLTSFQAKNLNIQRNTSSSNVFNEAYHLLHDYFIFRDKFSPSEWSLMKDKLEKLPNSQHATQELVWKLDEPYTRFYAKNEMIAKRQQLYGVCTSSGITISRKLRIGSLFYGVKSMFLPSSNLRKFCRNTLSFGRSENNGANINHNDSKMWMERPKLALLKDFFQLSQNFVAVSFPFSLLLVNSVSKRAPAFYVSAILSSTLLGQQLFPHLFPLEVHSVQPEVAEFIDVREGDRILSMNNISYRDNPFYNFDKILNHGEEGEVVSMEVLRVSNDVSSKSIQQAPTQTATTDSSWGRITGFFKRSGTKKLNEAACSFTTSSPPLKKRLTAFSFLVPRICEKKSVELVKNYVDFSNLEYYPLSLKQGKGLGYISIKEFNERTFEYFQAALTKLNFQLQRDQSMPLQGLMIDLRGNPGGPVPAALDIAALFLARGKPVLKMATNAPSSFLPSFLPPFTKKREESKEKIVETHFSQNPNADETVSLLLLTDSQTASASEILTEALCTNKRAISFGQRTVGKNLAQVFLELMDGSGLCFSVREFFAPDGRSMGAGHIPINRVDDPIDLSQITFNHTQKSWFYLNRQLV